VPGDETGLAEGRAALAAAAPAVTPSRGTEPPARPRATAHHRPPAEHAGDAGAPLAVTPPPLPSRSGPCAQSSTRTAPTSSCRPSAGRSPPGGTAARHGSGCGSPASRRPRGARLSSWLAWPSRPSPPSSLSAPASPSRPPRRRPTSPRWPPLRGDRSGGESGAPAPARASPGPTPRPSPARRRAATVPSPAPPLRPRLRARAFALAFPRAARARLEIAVRPGAEVEIDGTRHGRTPLDPLELEPGLRRLRLLNAQFWPLRRLIRLEAGATARLDVDLFWDGIPGARGGRAVPAQGAETPPEIEAVGRQLADGEFEAALAALDALAAATPAGSGGSGPGSRSTAG